MKYHPTVSLVLVLSLVLELEKRSEPALLCERVCKTRRVDISQEASCRGNEDPWQTPSAPLLMGLGEGRKEKGKFRTEGIINSVKC